MKFNEKEVGARIRALRMERNFTQEETAKTLNVGLDHYKRVEAGRRGCSIDTLIGMRELFHVSLDYLVLGEVSSESEENFHRREELGEIIEKLSLLRDSL